MEMSPNRQNVALRKSGLWYRTMVSKFTVAVHKQPFLSMRSENLAENCHSVMRPYTFPLHGKSTCARTTASFTDRN